MAIETKQLHALSKIYQEAVYGKSPEQIEASRRKKDDLAGAPLTVTNADKKANTPAWKNYKAGKKGYKAADHLKNESAEHRRNPEGTIKQRFKSKQTDPSKKGFTGIGDDIGEIMRQNAAMKKAAANKTKKEEFVDEKVATGPRLGEPREKGATHMNAGEQEKISKRTKAWMDKKGQKGAPGGDAMKARDAEHKARRGVKKEDAEYGYDKKGNSLNPVDIEKKKRKEDKLFGAPKVKKESFSDWRTDLKEIPNYEEIPISAKKRNEKISEKNVKNTVKINPEMKEEIEIDEAERSLSDRLARKRKLYDKTTKKAMDYARREGEAAGHARYRMSSLDREMDKVKDKMKKEEVEIISEKEVDVKDTRRTVDAIRAYDRAKDASRDATYDTDKGKKKKGDKEKAYAAKERGEIDKDDPNWKKRKYHTGIHGESYEATKTKEVMTALKKRDLKKDVKKKIAADIVKRKGDTSKSDDRYAYESKLWDEVAEKLTELGELGGVKFKVVPLEEGKKKKKYGLDDIDRAPGKPNTLTGTKGFLKYAEKMTPGQ